MHRRSLSPEGKPQGVLITLDDITEIEEQNVQLQTMVLKAQEKRKQTEMEEKNKELELPGDTRRADRLPQPAFVFGEQFEVLFRFKRANATTTELSCIMVDLDHFKSVNDNFGHCGTGDEVIKLLAEVLYRRALARTISSAATAARNSAWCCPAWSWRRSIGQGGGANSPAGQGRIEQAVTKTARA